MIRDIKYVQDPSIGPVSSPSERWLSPPDPLTFNCTALVLSAVPCSPFELLPAAVRVMTAESEAAAIVTIQRFLEIKRRSAKTSRPHTNSVHQNPCIPLLCND
jgi:hypothetical protein